jgi:site-specific DNA-methyltransferase (adenine-specific)
LLKVGKENECAAPAIADSGSAARFFYSAKANKADRNGSKHPTVKPIALMRWLAKLITPPGGTILDPFAGSGTTGAAAIAEGFKCVLIERETEYAADIRRRFVVSIPLPPITVKVK